jgi:hypothetical protein
MRTKIQSRPFVALLALGLLTSACGGGSPTGPTPNPGPVQEPPSSGSAASVQVISASTGLPLAGATVSVEKQNMSAVTNGEGKATFPQAFNPSSRIMIEAPGYLTRIASQNATGVYDVLGPRGDVPDEFIKEFIMHDSLGRGNSIKPRNNRIDIVLDNDIFRTEDIVRAHENVCAKVRAVGYGCSVYLETPPINGTLAIFRYDPTASQEMRQTSGAGTHTTWILTSDIRPMRSEPSIISKMVWVLGLGSHSEPSGAASKVQVTADFSSLEKQAIALYMPRQESVCFEDKVMLPVANVFGATCSYQAPFVK